MLICQGRNSPSALAESVYVDDVCGCLPINANAISMYEGKEGFGTSVIDDAVQGLQALPIPERFSTHPKHPPQIVK